MNDRVILIYVACVATTVAASIMLAVVLTTPRRHKPDKAFKRIRRRPSLFLFYLVYLFLLIAGAGLALLCGPFFPLGGLFVLILAGMIVTFILMGRDNLAMHVFSALGASMRQNLPLPTAMEAEARSLTGRAKFVFHNIATWLSQGFSLSESIRRGYPRCPGEALSMVAAAEHVGQTPKTIAVVERNIVEKLRCANSLQPMSPGYPIALVLMTLMILGGLVIFIIPKFQTIFSDIGCNLPSPTLWLLKIVDFTSEFGFVSLPSLIIFWIIPTALYLQFRPRRPEKPYALSVWGDGIKWFLPPLHWFERMRAQILAADFLRIALDAGATIDAAVAGACELDLNICYRFRLGRWLARIQRGENVSAAARAAGIGKTLAWAFDTDVNPNNAPAILEAIASAGRVNYAHARTVARSIFWPCVTLVLAGFVGFIAFAMYLPLPAMLNNMMDTMFT